MIKTLNPDVVTLDIEMPRMDGLAFLEKIMTLRPMPVVMISSLTQKGADAALRALEIGAVDFVAKPMVGLSEGFAGLRDEIVGKVKAAAGARVDRCQAASRKRALVPGPNYRSSERLIAVGASTGGVEALQELLTAFPPDAPAILVTQHMPRLVHGDLRKAPRPVLRRQRQPGRGRRARASGPCLYRARRISSRTRPQRARITSAGCTNSRRYRGIVPRLTCCSARSPRLRAASAVGIILTGMGKDGAAGLLEMRQAGASTIGQDEASCVVYGMPKAAHDCGATEVELPLSKIPGQVLHHCQAIAGRGVRV